MDTIPQLFVLISLLVFVALVFLILRKIVWWYFGIDQHLENQETMIRLLEVISTERTRNVSRPVITNTTPPALQSHQTNSPTRPRSPLRP